MSTICLQTKYDIFQGFKNVLIFFLIIIQSKKGIEFISSDVGNFRLLKTDGAEM